MPPSTVDDCPLIELPRVLRPQGNLTAIQGRPQIPFDVERVYYLYDVPGGASRGGHAHRALQQVLIAVMGAFDVVLDDGQRRRTVTLNRAYAGLVIPAMIWRELVNFSTGGVCLVLASQTFDEADYIRDYPEFMEACRLRQPAGVNEKWLPGVGQ